MSRSCLGVINLDNTNEKRSAKPSGFIETAQETSLPLKIVWRLNDSVLFCVAFYASLMGSSQVPSRLGLPFLGQNRRMKRPTRRNKRKMASEEGVGVGIGVGQIKNRRASGPCTRFPEEKSSVSIKATWTRLGSSIRPSRREKAPRRAKTGRVSKWWPSTPPPPPMTSTSANVKRN